MRDLAVPREILRIRLVSSYESSWASFSMNASRYFSGRVSIADCKVDGATVSGRAGTPTDFGHLCDTKGGSSGSPVLHFESRNVVGLHHLGISAGSSKPFNRASHIELVLAAMDPEVRAEIEAGQ